MGLWQRMFGARDRDRDTYRPLYHAIVGEARRAEWYSVAGVPDTIDGRFDMLAMVLSFVLIRLEREGAWGREAGPKLTELFIDDMDATMREIGYGDLVVGKRVGGLMGALGGRLGAFRSGDRRTAIVRNLYRETPPDASKLAAVEAMVGALEAGLAVVGRDELLGGRLA